MIDREDGGASAPGDRLAPVIPLFGAAGEVSTGRAADNAAVTGHTVSSHDPSRPRDADAPAEQWHPTWTAPARDAPNLDSEAAEAAELAEKVLLKKLRTRSLSVTEARGVLREHAIDADTVDRILQGLEELGYLDDAALAEQLLHVAVDRKGQGRQVIAQTLAMRGIARDVADAAIAALPDDDHERALEYARSKAHGLRSYDLDVAVRRLMGQLARRGYGGSVAATAARTALTEQRGSSGVQFR